VPHRSDENPTAPEPAHTPRRAARRTPHGLSVVAQTQLADQVIRGCTDTLHVRPARPQLGQDRLRQPRHQVHSNDTHMPMMHHSNIDQLTIGAAPVPPGWRPPTPSPPKTSVFKLSLLFQAAMALMRQGPGKVGSP